MKGGDTQGGGKVTKGLVNPETTSARLRVFWKGIEVKTSVFFA